MFYPIVTSDEFSEVLQEGLGSDYDRAWEVAHKCGRFVTFDIMNALLHAIDKGKVTETLDAIEVHSKEHLAFQHPDIRGTVADAAGHNPTKEMFRRIYEDVLGLDPTRYPVNF